MKINEKSGECVTVTLSFDELVTINNALNEVCNALHIREFQTRMGSTIEETRELLSAFNRVLADQSGPGPG